MLKPLLPCLVVLAAPMFACELNDLGDVRGPTTVSIAASSENGLSVNGLRLSGRHLTRFRTQALGVAEGKESLNGLDPSRLRLNEETSEDLESTAQGRALLKYIATCALPPETDLVVSHDGVESAYPGLLNLAPQWAEGECDEECQGWISACLLAHANARGEHVFISLRGPHPSLEPTVEEAEAYQFEEGAFFGQLFAEDPLLYACTGEDTFESPMGAAGLMSRMCSRGQCGVLWVGRCFPLGGQSACSTESPYDDCITLVNHAESPRRSQVITVMLEADPFSPLR